jgi:hypothetical protein
VDAHPVSLSETIWLRLGLHGRIIPDREQPQQETFSVGRWSLDFGRNESTHRASRVCKLPPTVRD